MGHSPSFGRMSPKYSRNLMSSRRKRHAEHLRPDSISVIAESL
jgi:hypothetical protein